MVNYIELRQLERQKVVEALLNAVEKIEEIFDGDIHVPLSIACLKYLVNPGFEPRPTQTERMFFEKLLPHIEGYFESKAEKDAVVMELIRKLLEPEFSKVRSDVEREDRKKLAEHLRSEFSVN